MSDEKQDEKQVEPALTSGEWIAYPSWPTTPRLPIGNTLPLYFPTRHGIAAANLYGQPFGFTHDDVVALRVVAATGASPGGGRALRSLANRIEALLPPPGMAVPRQSVEFGPTVVV